MKQTSHQDYSIRKEKTIHQSTSINFGKETEIEVEIMVCERCSKDCRTANMIVPAPYQTSNNWLHYAVYGLCMHCGIGYFRK